MFRDFEISWIWREFVKEIYGNGVYQKNNPTWHEEDAPWKARQICAILRDNGIAFRSVCEVGCGTGEILHSLEKSYPDAEFTGYEISPQAFQAAINKQFPKIKFYLKDLLSEDNIHFDVVLAIDVIEHIEDYIGFLRKLKHTGRYKIFHIPLDLSVQSLFRSWPILKGRRDVGHIHYFFKETALAALQDCGYQILDLRYTASRLELPNQVFTSRLMATPRRLLHRLSADLAVRVLGGYSLLVLAE